MRQVAHPLDRLLLAQAMVPSTSSPFELHPPRFLSRRAEVDFRSFAPLRLRPQAPASTSFPLRVPLGCLYPHQVPSGQAFLEVLGSTYTSLLLVVPSSQTLHLTSARFCMGSIAHAMQGTHELGCIPPPFHSDASAAFHPLIFRGQSRSVATAMQEDHADRWFGGTTVVLIHH